jgi:hypothetical protein
MGNGQARDFLQIPATSVPSEQVFSDASDLVTKKRNRMTKDTIHEIMCLKDWGVFGDHDDAEDGEGQ